MKTLRKAPWVFSVLAIGFEIGSIAVLSFGPPSAAPSPPATPSIPVSGTVTANQGTAGTAAWPVSGTVGVSSLPSLPAGSADIGNVGITGELPTGSNNIGEVSVSNLPSTQKVSGTVDVAPQTPYTGGCANSDTGAGIVNCVLAPISTSNLLLEDVSIFLSGIASGDSAQCGFFTDNISGDYPVNIPMISEGLGYFVGNISDVAFSVGAGNGATAQCFDIGSGAGEALSFDFTATGYAT